MQWAPDGRGVAYVRNIKREDTSYARIEFADTSTGTPHVLLSGKSIEDLSRLEEGLQDMTWLPDGRLVFGGGQPDIHGTSCNLWQSRIDLRKLRASVPERMTDWSGFCVNNLSQTADGKKLVFNRLIELRSVYVSDFDAANFRITEPRRLSVTEDISSPAGWTLDSRDVLIRSNREGSWGLYRRAIEGNKDAAIVTGREAISIWVAVTPHAQWILFEEPAVPNSGLHRLMRTALEGGPVQEVLQGRDFHVGCPVRAANTCVMGELSADHKQLIFKVLDPIGGRGAELTRIEDEHADELQWDLCPTEPQVLLHVPFTNELRLFSLMEKRSRVLNVKGPIHLRSVTWAADGGGFFATNILPNEAQLIHVDLQGNAHVLWTAEGNNTFLAGKESPDRRHVAIQKGVGNSNLWMAENF